MGIQNSLISRCFQKLKLTSVTKCTHIKILWKEPKNSRYIIQTKKIFINAVFLRFHNINYMLLDPLLSSEKLFHLFPPWPICSQIFDIPTVARLFGPLAATSQKNLPLLFLISLLHFTDKCLQSMIYTNWGHVFKTLLLGKIAIKNTTWQQWIQQESQGLVFRSSTRKWFGGVGGGEGAHL